MSFVLDLALLATGWAYVFLAPYTKVEESFNLHAIHDILMYGVRPSGLLKYDHFVFSSPVPRTFLGSLVVAWMSTPFVHLANAFALVSDKFDLQVIVRLVLSSVNAVGLCLLRRAVSRRFGRPTSLFFVLLSCSQFHVPFWMGRTLPNMLALFPVTFATYLLIDRAPHATRPSQTSTEVIIALLTCTAVVSRSEIALLLAPLALQLLVLGHVGFVKLIKIGVISGFASIALTVAVDSYFWKEWPIWPEFASVYFNVIQGKSSEWGVSPYHIYISSYVPKMLMTSLPLALLGCILDGRIRGLLAAPLAFIALISCLGHKEWRFIVYVVPTFNVAAARGTRWLVSRRKGTIFGRLAFAAVMGCLVANVFATYLLARASVANYPGGEALKQFNDRFSDLEYAHVHISNLASQTGASLFLQTHAPPYPSYIPAQGNWTYDKTESLGAATFKSGRFTHLIAEFKEVPGNWRAVDVVDGFVRWSLDLDAAKKMYLGNVRPWDVLTMVEGEKLWIMEKTN